MRIVDFFSDPVLRAPTIGSMLMCFAAALVGVLVFIRKRSLLGEALSHATYPGVTSAIILAGFFSLESTLAFLVLLGAFFSALAGLWVIDRMEKKLHVSADAAMAAILSLFFGIGIVIASFAQSTYAHLYRQMQTFLYGQAATMTDLHVLIYGLLTLLILLFILIFYKKIITICFDQQFAKTSGIAGEGINLGIFLIVVLALVVGIRCVGVILMSAMLIAPAVAARQFTNRLSHMFIFAGFFGILSAFLGLYISVSLSGTLKDHYSVPTGPMIVLVSGSFALYALFFAPKRGLASRYIRIMQFRSSCIQENLLKAIWRQSQGGHNAIVFDQLARYSGFSRLYLHLLIFRLKWQKALVKNEKGYQLTALGTKKGARIVRLHRLWEVYLVHSLGLKVEKVHKSAEEMEHILTPELEKQLLELLDNPRHDPHQQPIPEG